MYSNSSPAISPNFRGNLFTNGRTNNSFAKSIYYFADKYFVLTDNGQLFTSLDLVEWSYQSQTAYNIFLGDDITTIYAISSNPVYNSNALLQFDSSSAVLMKSQDIDTLGIDSEGNSTLYNNLYVFGEISTPSFSSNGGSNTITHLTQTDYPHNLEPGIFVESKGEIYKEPDFMAKYQREKEKTVFDCACNILVPAVFETITEIVPKNPYENCICKIKRANSINKNIVGVLTSVNPVKFATHGDVLIKVISDTYSLGDVLIPTIDGYAKKATSGEMYDALFMMIPRAKITSLVTDIPNTVAAILL